MVPFHRGLFCLAALMLAASLAVGDDAPCRCDADGCPSCRLKPVTKEVKKNVYSVKCVPYCQSRGCLLCGLFRRQCDCPRTKRVLMKKETVVGQKCELQCVLEDKPAPVSTPSQTAPPPAPAPADKPSPAKPKTAAPRTATGHPSDEPGGDRSAP